ncbi:DinB family protein [Paludisphaera soli]|uniref:DinB family protein n=1 Tax=Paludisphaera soli TaxID=2712865 RepID=UPI0013ED9A3D|nr:DinB family protein [Paludisphaera soli]
MPDPVADRFRRWFQYECDAHARVFDSLETVPPERRDSAEYRRAVDLMGHLIAARGIWLARIEGSDPFPGPRFPTDARLDDVKADWADVERRWRDCLSGLSDSDLARIVAYKTLTGVDCTDVVEDMLAQLFGHSSYHRGQVAMLVRAAGGTPAETDFIHWVRAQTGG